MVWGKNRNETPETQETPETEERMTTMDEKLPGLGVAMDAAKRFIQHAGVVQELLANGTAAEDIKKTPDMRRLKRASLDLTSELVILRKELP